MSLRWRNHGKGEILCAAKHPVLPDDLYIGDGLHYQLAVLSKVIVPDENEDVNGLWHMKGDFEMHGNEGQDAKTTGWLQRFGALKEILTEGLAIAEDIVGTPTTGTMPQTKPEEPACQADRISLRLEETISEADELMRQLRRIRDEF